MNEGFKDFKESLTLPFITDTEAALLYLKANFPKNENRFPPLHFLHQIYAIVKNKTKVDREASELQQAGKLIFYKLGGDKDNIAELVIFTEDIREHIIKHSKSTIVVKFSTDILPVLKNVFVDSSFLTDNFSLSKNNIRELVQENVLTIRDVGSYWLSFPRAGEFVKSYNCGRKEILRIIKKSKYSEILESELRKRKLSKKATLGMLYHISDVIGSEGVKCIQTTSGSLLRNDS